MRNPKVSERPLFGHCRIGWFICSYPSTPNKINLLSGEGRQCGSVLANSNYSKILLSFYSIWLHLLVLSSSPSFMKSWGLKWLAAQSWRRRLVSLSLPTGHTCGRPNEIIGPLLSTYTCYMACSTVQVHVTQIYICNTASQYPNGSFNF